MQSSVNWASVMPLRGDGKSLTREHDKNVVRNNSIRPLTPTPTFLGAHFMAKILIVDDDFFVRVILKHAFEDDHDVLLADSGRQALALVEWEQPDLILLDVRMLGLDGVTTGQLIASRHATPIIFMSEDPCEIKLPKEISHCRIVRKPFEALELHNIINSYVQPETRQKIS